MARALVRYVFITRIVLILQEEVNMRKMILTVLAFFTLTSMAFALPLASGGGWTDYEYYQSASTTYSGTGSYPGEFLNQGDQRSFFFDLKNLNTSSSIPFAPTGTDSTLTLMGDVSGYTIPTGNKPLTMAWASVSIFSVDTQWDQYNLEVKANYNNFEYDLGTAILDVNSGNSNTQTSTFNFTNDLLDAWRSDPLGLVELTLTSYTTGSFGFNDFNLLEVGIGASPVPEPGTLLLLGSGLIGLAYLKRRKQA